MITNSLTIETTIVVLNWFTALVIFGFAMSSIFKMGRNTSFLLRTAYSMLAAGTFMVLWAPVFNLAAGSISQGLLQLGLCGLFVFGRRSLDRTWSLGAGGRVFHSPRDSSIDRMIKPKNETTEVKRAK